MCLFWVSFLTSSSYLLFDEKWIKVATTTIKYIFFNQRRFPFTKQLHTYHVPVKRDEINFSLSFFRDMVKWKESCNERMAIETLRWPRMQTQQVLNTSFEHIKIISVIFKLWRFKLYNTRCGRFCQKGLTTMFDLYMHCQLFCQRSWSVCPHQL